MKSVFHFLAQLSLIWFIYFISDYIVSVFRMPIPSSVFGMVLLFILLSTRIIPTRFIERGGLFLNKHLAFFFIPFAVGIMNYGGLIKHNGIALVVMIAASTIIGLSVTAGTSQFLTRKEKAKHEQHHFF